MIFQYLPGLNYNIRLIQKKILERFKKTFVTAYVYLQKITDKKYFIFPKLYALSFNHQNLN